MVKKNVSGKVVAGAVAVVLAVMGDWSAAQQQQQSVVRGPGGQVAFTLRTDGPRLGYSVAMGETPVVEASPLVFTVDGVELTSGAKVAGAEAYSGDETYETRGVHSRARDRHQGVRYSLVNEKTGTRFVLDVRAFDEGVAFRFVVPGEEVRSRVPDEATVFTLPAGAVAWFHNLSGHYEGSYKRWDVAEVPAGEWAAPPMTYKLPGGAGYAAITEAELVNYSGMALKADGGRAFEVGLAHRQPVSHPYELRYSKEDIERLSHPAAIAGTITTPWRVVLAGRDLNALVNSDVITSLNPPADPKVFPEGVRTPWVKAGRAVWRYLDNGEQRSAARTTRPAVASSGPSREMLDEVKKFTDGAAELGFEYNILEGYWRRWSDEDLKKVVDYAKGKGVGIFLWVHSKGLHDRAARRELFDKCRDIGVAGLKIDFFDHEHKEVVDLYEAILRETAERHLMVDFHGANKPTGLSRTWPNEMVREAVRGMESSRLANRAEHETTLPFTRLLAGPAEYTPVIFSQRRGDTTVAHQIADAAVFAAPLLTYASHPEKLLESPARELIESVPPVWDETIVMPGSEIGQCAAFARRTGETWFVAVINGSEARSLSVPLTFLGDGRYQATIMKDRQGDPAAIDLERDRVQGRQGVLKIDCPAGGGFLARLRPG